MARPLCVLVRPDYPGNPLNPHAGGELFQRLSGQPRVRGFDHLPPPLDTHRPEAFAK
jgi:hypothetical protein